MARHILTKEDRSKGGQKSKKRPFDEALAENIGKYLKKSIKKGAKKTKFDVMLDAAYAEFLKGNFKPLAYLIDRGFGKARMFIATEIDPSEDFIDLIKAAYDKRCKSN